MSQLEPPREGLPALGQVVDGRYRIDALLGVGGMGAVFAADDTARQQPVAIKVMLAAQARHADSTKRFMREARAAKAIDDVHVARVMGAGTLPSGLPYMVMELLVGRGVDKVIREQAPLPIPIAVDYLLQACEGVARAHALGIIHRDLKPSNLYAAQRPDGAVVIKVLDFGIAKATLKLDADTDAASLTESSSTLGSPQYMSPEQLRCAKSVDARADIWSLGLILHRMLTGRSPFEADNVGAQFAMIISDPPTRLREHLPGAPIALQEIILCCLEKNVSFRYQDVAQLAEALLPFAPAAAAARVVRIRAVLDAAGASCPSLPERASTREVEPAPRSDASPTVRYPGGEEAVTTRAWGAPSQPSLEPRTRRWQIGAVALFLVGVAMAGYLLLAAATARGPVPAAGEDNPLPETATGTISGADGADVATAPAPTRPGATTSTAAAAEPGRAEASTPMPRSAPSVAPPKAPAARARPPKASPSKGDSELFSSPW